MRKRYTTYSEYLNIDFSKFEELNVLDPAINRDLPLFIDPRLLKTSEYELFNKQAQSTYNSFYENLANNIRAYLKISDKKIKRNAYTKLLTSLKAKEPVGLGLGYSKRGNSGQGVGYTNAEILLKNAIDLYNTVNDIGIEAFSLLNLLTEGIGADYIGDITANIIMKELYIFTQEIAEKLKIKTEKFVYNEQLFYLPRHPKYIRKIPILLVPKDILSECPREIDFQDVIDGYTNQNEQLRSDINEKISAILISNERKAIKQRKLVDLMKENKLEIYKLSRYLSKLDGNAYDFEIDSHSYLLTQKLLKYLNKDDLIIEKTDELSIIDTTIRRFEKFIENNNELKRYLLWNGEKYKNERSWQQLFHAFVNETLYVNNINIEQERETGSGPVDFCFSKGSKLRVLVELKLSKNNPQKGLTKQLEKYKECTDNVKAAYFICFNVHKEKQTQTIISELNKEKARFNLDTKIVVIDGRIHESASKL